MFNQDQKRAFIAVLLSGIVLFGWQYYFAQKAPAPAAVTTQPVATTTDLKEQPKTENPATLSAGTAAAAATPAAPITIQPFTLKRDQ